LTEEGQLTEQLVSGGDKIPCNFNSLLSFLRRRGVFREARIFQLIPSTPEICKRPESVTELGPDCTFDCIMSTVCCGAYTLLRQQAYAGEPCGVVGQHISAVVRQQPFGL